MKVTKPEGLIEGVLPLGKQLKIVYVVDTVCLCTSSFWVDARVKTQDPAKYVNYIFYYNFYTI